MGIPASTPEFLAVITQSNLLDASTLNQYVSAANADQSSDSPPADDPTQLAGAMVRDGLLTRFQAEQLLQGKWRGFFIGRYKVLGVLGSGGMGKVFLCEHPGMRRQVAIKVLPPKQAGDPETVERFYREAQAIARLDHRNIVHAYDVAEDGGVHYLVMEYVKGVTLENCVQQEGPLGADRVSDYLRQAALGLQHAYESGVVHRDIKPSNLLVTDTGIVKILDLGLARFFEQDSELSSRFGGAMMGTIDYMAPEQALNSSEVDIRADIYSLGATFYFALTSRSPFDGATSTQKLLMHQVSDPEPLQRIRPELPSELTAIIAKMMAKDPANRFQTPDELLFAMRIPAPETVADVPRATADTSPELPPATREERPARVTKPMRRFPKKIALVVGLGLLSAAAGLYLNNRPDASPVIEPDEPPPKPTVQARTVPTQPSIPKPLYLSNLNEGDATVGRGQFGKAGSLGYDNRRITVNGIVMAQGLSMHPPENGSSHARYALQGRFRTLAGSVAINDTGVGKPAVGQIFVVRGDGRQLWESKPVRAKKDEQKFAIDVTGVHRLELEVRCPGSNANAHAVWCDPGLYGMPVTVADLPTPKTIDQEGFIHAWLILAPIPNGGDFNQTVDKQLVKDEAKLAPKEGDKVKVGDKEFVWDRVTMGDYFFELEGYGVDNCTAYAVTYIVAPDEMKDVTLRIGSDDGAKVYVNSKEVGKFVGPRGINKDQNWFPVTLKKGVNTLVFKIVNGNGKWGGAARFVDKEGNPIQGIGAQITK